VVSEVRPHDAARRLAAHTTGAEHVGDGAGEGARAPRPVSFESHEFGDIADLWCETAHRGPHDLGAGSEHHLAQHAEAAPEARHVVGRDAVGHHRVSEHDAHATVRLRPHGHTPVDPMRHVGNRAREIAANPVEACGQHRQPEAEHLELQSLVTEADDLVTLGRAFPHAHRIAEPSQHRDARVTLEVFPHRSVAEATPDQ
jgi:hypothetical protein